MDYKGIKFNISIRLAGLLLTMFALVALIYDNAFILTILFIVIILGIQVISLFKFLDKSREGLLTFLKAIKSRDFSQSYPTDTPNDEQNKVNYEFNEIMEQFNTIKKEREADFQYLKNIVQHVGIGLITFGNNGDVQISNTASKNLLKFKHIDNIRELSSLSEELVDIFFRLKTGGRDLIKLNIQGDIVQLAVYAIE